MARAYGLRRERLEEQARRRAAKKGTSGVFAQGCCFYKLLWLFLIGAFLAT